MMTRFILLVLVLGALAGAFYGGRKYKGPVPFLDQGEPPIPTASPAPAVVEDPLLTFEKGRREVDADPNAWLANKIKDDVTRANLQNSFETFEPEFVYLYGRASLLARNNEEAARAFQSLIERIDRSPSAGNATLRKEATFGLAAVALNLETARRAAQTRLNEVIPDRSSPSTVSSPPASPASSPLSSP